MPSNFVTGNGQAKINSSQAGNKNNVIAKASGTVNTAFTVTSITPPSVFDGSSNDGISNAVVEGSGPVGNSIGYVLGTGVQSADQVRKSIELTVSNYNSALSDPLHDKTSDRLQVLQASGLRHTVNGTLINATGAAVTTPDSASANYITGGNSVDGGIQGFGKTQSFYSRVGITNVEQTVEKRSI